MARVIDIVRKLAPNARPGYLSAFEKGERLIADAGITTPKRLAHFLAQVLHETGGLTVERENMNYRAERIREVWPSRPEAVQFAGNPQALANSVYANRMGNGPPSSGDGYKYRGRGLMQTTGRYSYAKYGKRWGVDFEVNPELVLSPEHALKPALGEWKDGGCNEMADRDDILGITKRINGGTIGLASRKAWLKKTTAACGVSSPLKDAIKIGVPAGGTVAVGGGAAADQMGYGQGAQVAIGVVIFAVVAIGAFVVIRRRK